jgi:ribosomal biogenesis protein LAS1
VEPLLRQYKSLLKKSLARGDDDDDDTSLHSARAVLREIERWLSEARVAAAAHPATMNEYGGVRAPLDDDAGDDDDPRSTWALDQLCEALLARGALVPLSRK